MIDYIGIAQQRIADEYPTIVYGKPAIQDLPAGTILGTWAYSVPHVARFILARDLELATGVLPADVSRAWIRDQYKLPLRRRKQQIFKPFVLPLHAQVAKFPDCAYVDIKGAYLRILSLGYDVEYIPGRYIGCDPRAVPDQIRDNKFCYAIAVAMSSSRRGNITVVGKEGVFTHTPYNMFSNPCLYALACDTLNAIGAEVLAVMGDKVHYINTDGYIVDREFVEPLQKIINSWGFTSRIKADGPTQIFGVGSWICGDEKTQRRDGAAKDFTSKLADRDQRKWLKARWQKLANLID